MNDHPKSSKGGLMLFHDNRMHSRRSYKVRANGALKYYFRSINSKCHGAVQCEDGGAEGVYNNIITSTGISLVLLQLNVFQI